VAVLVPVLVIVPRADPDAVHTVAELDAAARLQVTALLLVPVTVALNRTVVGVVVVLTGTEAGDVGVEVTVTVIGCWPPLPGCAIVHPPKHITSTNIKARDTYRQSLGANICMGPYLKRKCIGEIWGIGQEL
jgi:uncharacterized membrane protein